MMYKIMKCFLCGMLLSNYLDANAAPFAWENFDEIWIYNGEYPHVEHDPFSGYEWYTSRSPFFNVFGERVGSGLRFWAQADTYMEFKNTVVLTVLGEVVSREYMDSQTEFFYTAEYSTSSESVARADYSVFLDVGESAFFAYSISSAMSGDELTWYGWMELQLNEEGLLVMKNNASEEAFKSIVVGGIPEPSCALLFLVGCATLMLKRGRGANVLRLRQPVF